MKKLYNDDCLNIMRSLKDKSIEIIITYPPYGLGEWVDKKTGKKSEKHVTAYRLLE